MRTRVSTYLMMFDDLEKVVPNEFKGFKEKAEQCLVILRLKGYGVDFKDVILYVQNAEGRLYDDFVDEDEDVRDEIDEIFVQTISRSFVDLQNTFEEKTNLDMFVNWSEEKKWLYIDFPEHTMMVLSPESKQLRDLDVGFIYDEFVDV